MTLGSGATVRTRRLNGWVTIMLAAILLPVALFAPWRRAILLVRTLALPLWVETLADVAYGPFPENRLDIMRPRGSSQAPRPAVIVFHGGAWERGSREEMREHVCGRYLARGFVVVNVEYRHGIAPATEDAIRAVEWFCKHASSYGGDPLRVVVTGESAGGHLALIAAFRSESHIAAVVNFYGVADLMAALGMPYVREALPADVPAGVAEFAAGKLSPVTWVRPGLCPVLSIHGTADDTVPLNQSERLTEKLRSVGGDAELAPVAGGGHGFSPAEQEIAYLAVFDFLRRCGVLKKR